MTPFPHEQCCIITLPPHRFARTCARRGCTRSTNAQWRVTPPGMTITACEDCIEQAVMESWIAGAVADGIDCFRGDLSVHEGIGNCDCQRRAEWIVRQWVILHPVRAAMEGRVVCFSDRDIPTFIEEVEDGQSGED